MVMVMKLIQSASHEKWHFKLAQSWNIFMYAHTIKYLYTCTRETN